MSHEQRKYLKCCLYIKYFIITFRIINLWPFYRFKVIKLTFLFNFLMSVSLKCLVFIPLFLIASN